MTHIEHTGTPRPLPVRRTSACVAWLAAVGLGMLLGGCASAPKPQGFDIVVARFYIETPVADPKAEEVVLPVSGVRIPLARQVVLSELDYVNVELVKVDLGLCLMFEFPGDAAKALHRLTATNIGRRLVVRLNGQAFGARVIDGPIRDGRLFIFLELPDEALAREAVNLKRTALEIVQPAVARNNRK